MRESLPSLAISIGAMSHASLPIISRFGPAGARHLGYNPKSLCHGSGTINSLVALEDLSMLVDKKSM